MFLSAIGGAVACGACLPSLGVAARSAGVFQCLRIHDVARRADGVGQDLLEDFAKLQLVLVGRDLADMRDCYLVVQRTARPLIDICAGAAPAGVAPGCAGTRMTASAWCSQACCKSTRSHSFGVPG